MGSVPLMPVGPNPSPTFGGSKRGWREQALGQPSSWEDTLQVA